MRFPYLVSSVSRPVYPLGGATVRHYPVLATVIGTAAIRHIKDGLVDSASDDTIFPLSVARQLGIDLRNAPVGDARPVAGATLSYRYAHVTLRITDVRETCEWPAIVGFIDLPMRWALLGQTGFLQFFDVILRGADREVVLTPASFPGRHTVH